MFGLTSSSADPPPHWCVLVCLLPCSHFETTMNDVALLFARITGKSLASVMAKDEKK